MMFRFGPIDFDRFNRLSTDELQLLARRGFESGQLARAALHLARDPYSDDGWFNISRLNIDASDVWSLGHAEMQGRKQAWNAARFLQSDVPGCALGHLRAFGTQVGIRETRRVAGDHILTAEELLEPAQFPDAIAAGAYPIDIHPSVGGGLDYRGLGDDHAYQIPYRSLVPKTLDNALVVGRGISATHQALAAIRVMTISMAVGQAAGVAAAMAGKTVSGGLNVRDVPVADLQRALREQQALLQ